MPDPSQGAAPPPGGGAGAPTPPPQSGGAPPQGDQANDLQKLLANWYQVTKQMAASDPRLASGANKVAEGIQEMQTALVTPSQPTPVAQQPPY
jgi:hypothetical protein